MKDVNSGSNNNYKELLKRANKKAKNSFNSKTEPISQMNDTFKDFLHNGTTRTQQIAKDDSKERKSMRISDEFLATKDIQKVNFEVAEPLQNSV